MSQPVRMDQARTRPQSLRSRPTDRPGYGRALLFHQRDDSTGCVEGGHGSGSGLVNVHAWRWWRLLFEVGSRPVKLAIPEDDSTRAQNTPLKLPGGLRRVARG